MSHTIHKERLEVMNVQQVMLPEGAEILCAREQFNAPCIWFLCEPYAPKKNRTIAIVGTGHAAPMPSEARYVGTCSLDDGQLILHVFERIER